MTQVTAVCHVPYSDCSLCVSRRVTARKNYLIAPPLPALLLPQYNLHCPVYSFAGGKKSILLSVIITLAR